MPMPKAPRWTPADVAILREVFPRAGVTAACAALPKRTWQAIQVKASRLGLLSPVIGDAPLARLRGEALEEAIRLRESDGWSFARIGAHFGVCESSACNAVLIALCPRKGFTPAQRDEHGRITAEGMERLHWMLRKGMKTVDIQLRLGLSASSVSEQRRRYARDLKARGKAPLPPAGNGERYSGARISRATMREVERMLIGGIGGPTVADRIGVSKTHVQRIRGRLVKRLARKGQTLGGCDRDGRRRRIANPVNAIPAQSIAVLRAELMRGTPCLRAAAIACIGTSKAYRLRDALRAELAAAGTELPAPILPGRRRYSDGDAKWLPTGRDNMILYRRMLRAAGGDVDEAKRMTLSALAAAQPAPAPRRSGPLSFEEQMARVAGGAALVEVIPLRRPDPAFTAGGVATGLL